MFCRPCFNRFGGLKYIPRLFSEYMLTFRVEEPMKICVTNLIRNIYIRKNKQIFVNILCISLYILGYDTNLYTGHDDIEDNT